MIDDNRLIGSTGFSIDHSRETPILPANRPQATPVKVT
jgi:hypothetical protein